MSDLIEWVCGWRWQTWLILILLIGNGGQTGAIIWKNRTIELVEAEKKALTEKITRLESGEATERAIANDQASDVSAAVDRAAVIMDTSKKRVAAIKALPIAPDEVAAIQKIINEYPGVTPW